MEFDAYTLKDWLVHIQNQHWRSMDLSLDRITEVWGNLSGTCSGYTIVVAGTNGKGSSISMLDAVFQQCGRRTGAYTSPHLVRYNERIRICGEEVSDREICDAFCHIEQFRNGIPLTYFEYGTLCALVIFQKHQVEVALLEVGMGGRLDAVNMVDNDLVLLTSISIDHEHWLGSDREKIAAEKAGVIKQEGMVVCTDSDIPASLRRISDQKQACLVAAQRDYFVEAQGKYINWSSDLAIIPPFWRRIDQVSTPLSGEHQKVNLGGVVAALAISSIDTGLDISALQPGLDKSNLTARCQIIRESPVVIADVAHNEDSARQLADYLNNHACAGQTIAVFGMLEDKAAGKIIAPLAELVNQWVLAALDGERGQSSEMLAGKLTSVMENIVPICHDTPVSAYCDAISRANPEDRVVIFGSFYMVGDIIDFLEGDKLPSLRLP